MTLDEHTTAFTDLFRQFIVRGINADIPLILAVAKGASW
jgi:hypothetical protein